ncbi:helix-turn-helix DNA binding domain protein [Mycobacterium phage Cracklewink]|nr:helix-turn-helix DNA binding domain protein [Mycobacterium phage Cracklewink]
MNCPECGSAMTYGDGDGVHYTEGYWWCPTCGNEIHPDDDGTEEKEARAMTPAEFRITRDYLGLPPVWLAERLNVRERTLSRWEHGGAPIPPGVMEELAAIAELTARRVDSLVEELEAGGELVTYRTDEDYRSSGIADGRVFPASWHRAIAARVMDACPNVVVVYSADQAADAS